MTYTDYSPDFIKDFYALVEQAENILVTSHKNPDDDSIASTLSTYHILKDKYADKKIRVVYESTATNNRWGYFEHSDKVEFVEKIDDLLDWSNLVILVDVNTLDRAGISKEKMTLYSGKSICIDHHKGEIDAFDLSLIAYKPSNAENIYVTLGKHYDKIPKRLAELFLLGILGDNGWMTYISPEDTADFVYVKKLVEDGGINLQVLKGQMRGYSQRVYEVMAEYIKNSFVRTFKDNPACLVSYITREIYEKGYTESEVRSGGAIYISTFGTSLQEVPWALAARPVLNGGVKVEFRSRPDGVVVREIAEQFGKEVGSGGGHDLASGMNFTTEASDVLEVQTCLERLYTWLDEHTISKPKV